MTQHDGVAALMQFCQFHSQEKKLIWKVFHPKDLK